VKADLPFTFQLSHNTSGLMHAVRFALTGTAHIGKTMKNSQLAKRMFVAPKGYLTVFLADFSSDIGQRRTG
jgi:hypothetical protein